MTVPVVVAVHPVKLNLAPAKEFGSVVFINNEYVFGDELGRDDGLPDAQRRNLMNAARTFDPKSDYLLLVGDQVQVAYLSALLGKLHGAFRVLRYDRIARGYFPVLIAA